MNRNARTELAYGEHSRLRNNSSKPMRQASRRSTHSIKSKSGNKCNGSFFLGGGGPVDVVRGDWPDFVICDPLWGPFELLRRGGQEEETQPHQETAPGLSNSRYCVLRETQHKERGLRPGCRQACRLGLMRSFWGLLVTCYGLRVTARSILWQDDFDGDNLDPEVWRVESGNGCDQG